MHDFIPSLGLDRRTWHLRSVGVGLRNKGIDDSGQREFGRCRWGSIYNMIYCSWRSLRKEQQTASQNLVQNSLMRPKTTAFRDRKLKLRILHEILAAGPSHYKSVRPESK